MTTENRIKQSLPAGWPKDVVPPTIEEVEEAVRKGLKEMAQELETNKDKIRPLDSKALDIIVDI